MDVYVDEASTDVVDANVADGAMLGSSFGRVCATAMAILTVYFMLY